MMVCGWRLLTEAAARSTSSLAGCSPTGLLSWNPRPAVTTRRSQRTPVHANVASSTKSGLLHQSVHQYRHLACTSVHQCGPQAAPNPTSGLTHQHQRSGRIPAGQTLEYACVPPIYALAVFSLFNLKMQNSYKQRTPIIGESETTHIALQFAVANVLPVYWASAQNGTTGGVVLRLFC